jgi:hypothetical protein
VTKAASSAKENDSPLKTSAAMRIAKQPPISFHGHLLKFESDKKTNPAVGPAPAGLKDLRLFSGTYERPFTL